LFVNNTLGVSGAVNLSDTLDVSGTANLNYVNIASDLTVGQEFALTGNATIGGELSVTGTLEAGGTTINGNLVISNVGGTNGILTDNLYYSNGSPWDLQEAAGSNTEIQFNNNGDFGSSAGFTFDADNLVLTVDGTANITGDTTIGDNLTVGGNISFVGGNASTLDATVSITTANLTANGNVQLGDVANVHINGGNLGQVLTTDGTGALSWVTASAIVNTTSNVAINDAGGNITMGVNGTANVLTISDTGLDIGGGGSANLEFGSAGNIFTTGADSIDIFTNSKAANYSGVTLTHGSNVLIVADGQGWSFNANGSTQFPGFTLDSAITPTTAQVLTFNGTVATWATVDTDTLANGNSNVSIDTVGGPVTIGVGGTPNVAVFTTTGLTVTGDIGAGNLALTGNLTLPGGSSLSAADITATGNIVGGNLSTSGSLTVTGTTDLGSVDNVAIAGGTPGQYLQTDGSGNLSWSTVTANAIFNGTSNVSVDTLNGPVTIGANGQANIITVTSNGTFATTTINDNVIIAGDLTVQGNTVSVNVTELNIEDPILTTGRGANNAALLGPDGKDRGVFSYYYDGLAGSGTEKGSFAGYMATGPDVGQYVIATDAVVVDNVVTVNSYGNVVVGNVIGNLANGGTVVGIDGADGDITLSVDGTANVVVATASGIDVTGAVKVRTVTSIDAATLTTVATTQVPVASIADGVGVAVEFLVKGYDVTSGKFEMCTILAISSGGAVDYTVFGNTQIVGTPGAVMVAVSGGNIQLFVTPASTNSTVWTVQYRTI
jgi:hypothetical protein